MPYTGIGDIALARKLAGHPKDTEISPTDFEKYMEYGQDMLFLFTKKKNWNSGDTAFDQCSRIVEHFAASLARSLWRDPDNKSQELFNRAKTMVNAIMENQSFASDDRPAGVSQTSVAYKYRTPALNEETEYYKSPRTDF